MYYILYVYFLCNSQTKRQFCLIMIKQAAAGAVRLEGDVITANGSIISGHIPQELPSSVGGSLGSVCSCRCPKCPFRLPFCSRGQRPPRRLTLTKSPAKITHIQPFDRKSISAVYHRHPYQTPAASSSGVVTAASSSSRFHGHPLPSESFDLSPSRSPSPILELHDSPFKDSSKRMSVWVCYIKSLIGYGLYQGSRKSFSSFIKMFNC